MTIISFVNQKGGCGKTTLACMLALYLAEQKGLRVGVRDLDTQQSCTAFVEQVDHDRIQRFNGGADYDVVLVDTPGGIKDADLRKLLDTSDLVIVPLVLSGQDIKSTAQTALRVADRTKARIVLNRVKTSTGSFRERHKILAAIDLKPCKHYLCDRVSYSYAMTSGWEALDSKARQELTILAKELLKHAEAEVKG